MCVCVTEVSAVNAINLAEINKQNQQSNSKPQTKGVERTEVGLQSVWKWEAERERGIGRERSCRVACTPALVWTGYAWALSAYNWSIKRSCKKRAGRKSAESGASQARPEMEKWQPQSRQQRYIYKSLAARPRLLHTHTHWHRQRQRHRSRAKIFSTLMWQSRDPVPHK